MLLLITFSIKIQDIQMNGAVQNMSQGLFLLLSRAEKPELKTEREGS